MNLKNILFSLGEGLAKLVRGFFKVIGRFFSFLSFLGEDAFFSVRDGFANFFRGLAFLGRGVFQFFNNLFLPFILVDASTLRGKSQVTGLLPVIGYLIVIGSLADFVYVLVPLRLQNPVWELEAINLFVQQCWVFLIGLALVFSRYLVDNQEEIRGLDLMALRWLRWLVLVMAIALLLSLPLVGFNTLRVHRNIQKQVGPAEANQLAQFGQIKAQIDQVADPKIVTGIAQSVGVEPAKIQSAPLPQLKTAIKERVTNLEVSLNSQIKLTQQGESRKLFKSSFRIFYYILIISFAFVVIWARTGRINGL